VRSDEKMACYFKDVNERLWDKSECYRCECDWQPDYNIYDEERGEEIVRTIQIECPGVTEFDLEETGTGIFVKVKKGKTINEETVRAVVPIRESIGIFQKTIQIPDRHFKLASSESTVEHGILKVIFRKSLNSPEKKKFKVTSPAADCQLAEQDFVMIETIMEVPRSDPDAGSWWSPEVA